MGAPLPEGPWHTEPDRVEWKHAGVQCLMVRGPMAQWCGYVGVPPGHPWHGRGYSGANSISADVHGGITYARECQGEVCHVPEPGEPEDLWWVGFDCCHYMDLAPVMVQLDSLIPELAAIKTRYPAFDSGLVYREVAYVKREVESLAEQARGELER